MERGISWGAPQPAWVMTIKFSQTSDSKHMFNHFEIQNDEYMRNMSFSGMYGMGIERLHSGSYSFNDYIRHDALQYLDVCIEEILYSNLVW